MQGQALHIEEILKVVNNIRVFMQMRIVFGDRFRAAGDLIVRVY